MKKPRYPRLLRGYGKRVPSRQFIVDAVSVKEIRKKTGLTQAKFSHMIDVNLGTLRNWEQGRRQPAGPAKALLRSINNDPIHVLAALIQDISMDAIT